MIELTAEVSNKPDHAEIRIGGYLSSESAERLDKAMQQVGANTRDRQEEKLGTVLEDLGGLRLIVTR